MTLPSLHLSIAIARPVREVYDYAGDPRNLPAWASGLASGIRQLGEDWVSDSPMGSVRVRFAPRNDYGVLDHEVVLDDGTTFLNPLRALPNGEGTEVVFTLYRQPGVSDEDFETDAATIRDDLRALREILESED